MEVREEEELGREQATQGSFVEGAPGVLGSFAEGVPGEDFRVSFLIGPACSPLTAFLLGPSNMSRSYDGRSRLDIKGIKTRNPNSLSHFTHSLTSLKFTPSCRSLARFALWFYLPCVMFL
jgi:hypothetical protein